MKQEVQKQTPNNPDNTNIPNRKQRRSTRQINITQPTLQRLIDANEELKTVIAPRNRARDQADKDGFTSFVYADNEDPYLNYLIASRKVSLAFDDAKNHSDNPTFIKEVKRIEVYSRKIRGISLFDIEHLPLPLSIENMDKIGMAMRHNPLFARVDEYQGIAIWSALLLPSEIFARTQFLDKTKNRPVHLTLKNLHERMAGYLDYYTSFFTNPNVSTEQMEDMVFSAAWTGAHLFQSLGLYMPARLGLTPASTIKLIESKKEQFPYGTKGRIFNFLAKEAKNAYRPDALPTHLNIYQHYDKTMDQLVAGQLEEYYLNSGDSSLEANPEQMFNRLGLYQRKLLADIKTAGQELRVPLPNHPAIGEILVTSQYPQTLMFVLFMRKDDSHITLEVNNSNRMYGVPINLVAEYPHITDSIIVDILGTIIDHAKQRHPDIEIEPKIKVETISKIATPTTPVISTRGAALSAAVLESEQDLIKEDLRAERKRRTEQKNRSIIQQFAPQLGPQPELPKRPEERRPKYKVHHSRREIEEHLGGKAPKQVIDRIMRDITRFEYGEKKVSPMLVDNRLLKSRTGDYRVVYRSLDDGTFSVDRAGHRKVVYDVYDH